MSYRQIVGIRYKEKHWLSTMKDTFVRVSNYWTMDAANWHYNRNSTIAIHASLMMDAVRSMNIVSVVAWIRLK